MTCAPRREPVRPGASVRATVASARGRGRSGIARNVLHAAAPLRAERVSIGELFDRLGPEGLGLALLLLTLPTLIPIPGPVGMTFGMIIAFVSLQVMVGARSLWLPPVLRRRTLPGAALRGMIAQALPWLACAERWLEEGPLSALADRRARVALAFPLLFLAVAIMLPIPFGNVAPALALIAFSLGIMARDGAAILIALIMGLAALVWTGFLFVAGAAILQRAAALVGW